MGVINIFLVPENSTSSGAKEEKVVDNLKADKFIVMMFSRDT